MDIQRASNFERYLYYLLDENPRAVAAAMAGLERDGRLSVTEAQRREAADLFSARAVSEEGTLAQIRTFYADTGYVLDPHTAVGVAAAPPGTICLATAHPAKFGDAVRRATGHEPPLPPPLVGLLDRPSRCTLLDAEVGAVRSFIEGVLT